MDRTLKTFIVIALLAATVFFIVQSVLGVIAIVNVFKGFDVLNSFKSQLKSQMTEDPKPSTNRPLTSVSSSEINVAVIERDKFQIFMLRGGREVAVVDFLTLKVGSELCRILVEEKKEEISDVLGIIFLRKESSDILVPEGLELLKKEIRKEINELLGFSERDSNGVLDVYLFIKAVSSVH